MTRPSVLVNCRTSPSTTARSNLSPIICRPQAAGECDRLTVEGWSRLKVECMYRSRIERRRLVADIHLSTRPAAWHVLRVTLHKHMSTTLFFLLFVALGPSPDRRAAADHLPLPLPIWLQPSELAYRIINIAILVVEVVVVAKSGRGLWPSL